MLYFYPKDNTPGCTTEGAQFRDAYKAFRKAGATVIGVSRDSIKSHERIQGEDGVSLRAHLATPTRSSARSSTSSR